MERILNVEHKPCNLIGVIDILANLDTLPSKTGTVSSLCFEPVDFPLLLVTQTMCFQIMSYNLLNAYRCLYCGLFPRKEE